jgi:ABC-type transporter Mla subunit MlaD
MKRNLSDYFVALSVILCSAILLGALTIALTGFRLKKPSRTLQIDFEDVTGVKLHSEVRYAGAPAGRVIGMQHLSGEERNTAANKRNAVRVTVSLADNIPPLPADVSASLSSDTLLSPMFVALSAGTPGAEILANNAVIDGHPAAGIAQIAAAAGPLVDNVNKLVDNANKLIDSLTGTAGNLDTTITNVRNDLGQVLPKISPVLDVAKIDLEELQRIIKGLDDVEKNANALFDNAGKFLGSTDTKVQEELKELRVILLNLKVVSTHAKALTETLAEKPSRIIFSGKTQKLTPESEILKSKEPVPAKKP